MGRKRLELTGQKFGRLTVIRFSHIDKNGGSCWICKCSCGNEITVRSNSLKCKATKSCGCLNKEAARNHVKKLHRKNRLPNGVAARNEVIREHKNSAKSRDLEQALTDEQIIALHRENCHYCGVPPSNTYFKKESNGSYAYNGIDRVNSDKGYTLINSVSCCIVCNRAKSNRTYGEFLNWIKQAYLNLIP